MKREDTTMNKFYVIDNELLNTLIDLMLESIETSSDLSTTGGKENVMYFTWLYDELLDLPQIKNARKYAQDSKEKLLKDRTKDTLTDEEIKMLHYLNQIMKATAENKSSKPQSKESKKVIREEASRIKNELVEKMSLDEIKKYLLSDQTLTPEERFELYYQEHDRIKEENDNKGSMSFEAMCKSLGIERNPGKA